MTRIPQPDDDRVIGDDDAEAIDDELLETPVEASEADVVEQHQPVAGDDEDEDRRADGP